MSEPAASLLQEADPPKPRMGRPPTHGRYSKAAGSNGKKPVAEVPPGVVPEFLKSKEEVATPAPAPTARRSTPRKTKSKMDIGKLLNAPIPLMPGQTELHKDPSRDTIQKALPLMPLDLASMICTLVTNDPRGLQPYYSPIGIAFMQQSFSQLLEEWQIDIPPGWAFLIATVFTLSTGVGMFAMDKTRRQKALASNGTRTTLGSTGQPPAAGDGKPTSGNGLTSQPGERSPAPLGSGITGSGEDGSSESLFGNA
jgi:hypothetical protein